MDEEQYFKIPKVWLYVIFGLVTAGILVGVSVLGYYIFNNLQNKASEIVKINEELENIDIAEESTVFIDDSDTNEEIELDKISVVWSGKAVEVINSEKESLLNKLYPNYQNIVNWLKEPKDFCFDNSTLPMCNSGFDAEISLYKVGKTSDNNDIYYIVVPDLFSEAFSPGYRVSLGYYDKENNQMIKIAGYELDYDIESVIEYLKSNGYKLTGVDDFKSFVLYTDTKAIDLSDEFASVENSIEIKDGNIKLYPIGFFSATLFGTSNIENLGDFGLSSSLNSTNNEVSLITNLPDFKDGIYLSNLKYNNGCFYRLLPNGSIYGYRVQPYFFVDNNEEGPDKQLYPESFLTNIDWNNKKNIEERYVAYGQTGGCTGPSLTCNEIITNKEWFDKNNLVEIGKTNLGESVYELGDKQTNTFYKEFFDSFGYAIYGYEESQKIDEQIRFTNFLEDQPLFFWKDKWGNWRMYQKDKYRPLAECGKPVIYLYPEQEMDVNVKVAPNAGFSKTEPAYPENGWVVKSSIDSQIYNYADGTIYPYLFWEGNAYNFITPDYGFVMSKNDVPTKMNEILGRLGLVEKEINDFMEFWQPKLEVKPYVFVTFLPQREFDKIAPLTVNPAPDTVIRVMMDYKPLDAPVTVKEPFIWTPQRKGFIVVEWGGRLYR